MRDILIVPLISSMHQSTNIANVIIFNLKGGCDKSLWLNFMRIWMSFTRMELICWSLILSRMVGEKRFLLGRTIYLRGKKIHNFLCSLRNCGQRGRTWEVMNWQNHLQLCSLLFSRNWGASFFGSKTFAESKWFISFVLFYTDEQFFQGNWLIMYMIPINILWSAI